MAGTWGSITNQPPFSIGALLLLTDGAVLGLEANGSRCARLIPDNSGSYANGTWTQVSSMHTARLYYASAVLRDGRVLVAGGEYTGTNTPTRTTACEIYDPVLDQWTTITPPAGWSQVGDAPSCTLPDGRVLIGSIQGTSTSIFDPATNSFAAAASKLKSCGEESWVLLPDETVLTVECYDIPNAEKYVVPADKWVKAGSTPSPLVQASSNEIGPALLLPDGRALFVGATGRTALYTPPPVADQPGTWEAGPTFPNDANGKPLEAKDAPGCLLPNGKVLLSVGPAAEGSTFLGPTTFFEYDGSSLTDVSPSTAVATPPYQGCLLVTPDGDVLYSNQSQTISTYSPDGAPDEDWRPEITGVPDHVRQKQTHMLHGRLLNGLSQACAYGDDLNPSTNYPIVRLRIRGSVHYCRTFDHSTMGVATGLSIQSTHFKVPVGTPNGSAELEVVANGIASQPVPVTVGEYRIQFRPDEEMVNRLIGSLADGPLWVLGPDGPHPVDPWGPDIEKAARAAWEDIIAGVRELQKLGREVAERQQREARNTDSARPLPRSSTGSLTE
jgi:hypothetical protein